MRGFLYIFSAYIDSNIREITGGTAVWLNSTEDARCIQSEWVRYSGEGEDDR
jgi:hypothetical protein